MVGKGQVATFSCRVGCTYVRWLGKVLGGGWMEPERAFDIAELGWQKSWLVGPSIRVVLAEISQEA